MRDMRILSVTVIPQSSRNEVVPQGENSYKVYVTQPALKGKANAAMCKVLAQHLNVPQSRLILSRGDRSNEKTVILTEEL